MTQLFKSSSEYDGMESYVSQGLWVTETAPTTSYVDEISTGVMMSAAKAFSSKILYSA